MSDRIITTAKLADLFGVTVRTITDLAKRGIVVRAGRSRVPSLNVKAPMDMQDEWLRGLRSWASTNGNVRELWLFGSRATGRSRPDSDVDIAVALMPAEGGTDWALGNFFALHSDWKQQLEAVVGRHVSLEAILPNTPEDEAVRRSGSLLWSR